MIARVGRPSHSRTEADRLLQRIRTLVDQVRRLRAAGVTGRRLEALTEELERARWRLARIVREDPTLGAAA